MLARQLGCCPADMGLGNAACLGRRHVIAASLVRLHRLLRRGHLAVAALSVCAAPGVHLRNKIPWSAFITVLRITNKRTSTHVQTSSTRSHVPCGSGVKQVSGRMEVLCAAARAWLQTLTASRHRSAATPAAPGFSVPSMYHPGRAAMLCSRPATVARSTTRRLPRAPRGAALPAFLPLHTVPQHSRRRGLTRSRRPA